MTVSPGWKSGMRLAELGDLLLLELLDDVHGSILLPLRAVGLIPSPAGFRRPVVNWGRLYRSRAACRGRGQARPSRRGVVVIRPLSGTAYSPHHASSSRCQQQIRPPLARDPLRLARAASARSPRGCRESRTSGMRPPLPFARPGVVRIFEEIALEALLACPRPSLPITPGRSRTQASSSTMAAISPPDST